MNSRQTGFTLVEIAIVLVIIGLLLGGILKGQELINSARVRNLADTTSGIQAAYYGFIDRFRRVPGDWDGADAGNAIGQAMNAPGGDNNGRLDHDPEPYDEPVALWEQLSKAGFIQGSFVGAASGTEPDTDNNLAPQNAFNQIISIGRTDDYRGNNGVVRLNVVVGRGVPASIMRELDVKLDDGLPDTGILRGTVFHGTSGVTFGPDRNWGTMEALCLDTTQTPVVWDINTDSRDCNGAYLY